MNAREELIAFVIDNGFITDETDKRIFLDKLSIVEIQARLKYIEDRNCV